ncbi:MAG: guanylate kinase [Ruminococcus sp.]|nr:guanylate kinase [Ruminococcus sp.]MCD7800480.1 guanylate kinase [Ruminococcus sp.]
MNKGLLIVVSAPSGCGKGTMLKEILKDNRYYYSVSDTTREPRPNEIDGIHYNFLSKEKFQSKIDQDGMLEYAEYCENYYGTPKKPVEENLNLGKHVILEIEVQGAMRVKQVRPDAKFIFIAPPSIEELERRLLKRDTETMEVIQERVSKAKIELTYSNQYDYIIVNDELKKAIKDFKSIVRACELEVR